MANTFGPDVQSISINRRFVEVGNLRDEIDRKFVDAVVGVSLAQQNGLQASATYRYGRTSVRQRQLNRISRNKLSPALNFYLCQQMQGCPVVDFFSPSRYFT